MRKFLAVLLCLFTAAYCLHTPAIWHWYYEFYHIPSNDFGGFAVGFVLFFQCITLVYISIKAVLRAYEL